MGSLALSITIFINDIVFQKNFYPHKIREETISHEDREEVEFGSFKFGSFEVREKKSRCGMV